MKEILQIIKNSKRTETIIAQKKKEIQKLREENNLVIKKIRNKFEESIKPKLEEIKNLEESVIIDTSGKVHIKVGDLLEELIRLSNSRSNTPSVIYLFKSRKKYSSTELTKNNIIKDIKKQILKDIEEQQEKLILTLEFCSDSTFNPKKFKIRIGPIPVSFADKFSDGSMLIDNFKLYYSSVENEPNKYELILYELINNKINDFMLSLDYSSIDLIDQKCDNKLFKKALSNCILTRKVNTKN